MSSLQGKIKLLENDLENSEDRLDDQTQKAKQLEAELEEYTRYTHIVYTLQ